MMARPLIRSNAREERVFPLAALEVREGDAGTAPTIVGHAAVYNTWSQDLGGFKERVLPGAFDKSIGVADVRCLFNHDPNVILGRTKNGSLTLASEAKGLHYEATPLDTQTIRDLVLEPIRAGLIDQCSFSFLVREDAWREPKSQAGLWERDLVDVELYDVSPVTFPAYLQTDVGLRGLALTVGVDLPALSALLVRANRGFALTDGDRELVGAAVALLRSYLPEANGEEPSRSDDSAAGRTRGQLLAELEHRRRTTHLVPA
jgi:HK97 family phage prohead protease